MTNPLVEFWRRAPLVGPALIHPDDRAVFAERAPQALNSGPCPDLRGRHLHTHLLPEPFVGDLAHADIFVLSKNPGFKHVEYDWEKNSAFFERKRRSVWQEQHSDEVAHYYLDPDLAGHPGYHYWAEKLDWNIVPLLRNRLATLEIVPYHSAEAPADGLIDRLPSRWAAANWVQQYLLPRAHAGEVLVIAVRQVRRWGLTANDNVENLVAYTSGEARRASLTNNTRGARAISRWLNRHPY